MAVKKKRRVRGEDCLAEVEAISIRLESGRTRTFRIADEITPIPDDRTLLPKEAERVTARLAFWLYQAERAKAAARKAEEVQEEKWAHEYQMQRTHIQRGLVDGVEIATEANIRSRVALDGQVKLENQRVRDAWRRYGALRSLATALEHRSHLIRTLIRREPGDTG